MKKIPLLLILVGAVAAAAVGGAWIEQNTSVPHVTATAPKASIRPTATTDRDDMPYPPQFAEVNGFKTYFVEAGEGQPFVFLHGNPTQSYMWRNVLPYVAEVGRAIAFDWPGYGNSEKPYPPLDPQGFDAFFAAFLDEMNLEKVVLVIHDWSGMVAFNYAAQNPDRIAGIVFMETLVPPIMPIKDYTDLGKAGNFFKNVRAPFGRERLTQADTFVDLMNTTGFINGISEKAQKVYASAHTTPKEREVLAVWPLHLPIGGEPKFMDDRVNAYGEWFLNSPGIPKLFLYAEPGLFNKPSFAQFYAKNTPEVTSVGVGKGYHYIIEENADRIGQAIAQWAHKTFK